MTTVQPRDASTYRLEAARAASKVKSVAEFFSQVVDAVKDLDLLQAVGAAAPWVGMVGESAAAALPPVRFLATLAAKLGEERDVEVLGLTACTVAYVRAVEIVVQRVGKPAGNPVALAADVKARLAAAPPEDVDLLDFSIDRASSHEFVLRANAALGLAAEQFGYDAAQRTALSTQAGDAFRESMRALLAAVDTAEKFAPFARLIATGTDERRAYKALRDHARHQVRLFAERPLLSREPFALAHVYVDTECGVLTAGEIRSPAKDGRRRDPFDESDGGRAPLLDTLMRYVADPSFDELVLVQGAAGAGKTSFTLRLCTELVRRGLRPIRIRLRELTFDKHVSATLPYAIRLREDDEREPADARPTFDAFLGGRIFDERVSYEGATICPYVLVLDGWDEVQVESRGLRERVEELLRQVRSEYLDRKHGVRVILTGRPAVEVTDNQIIRDATPVLTVRPVQPEQLRALAAKVARATAEPPLAWRSEADRWVLREDERLETLLTSYEQAYRRSQRVPTAPTDQRLDVLGSPLLAYLAFRLVARGEDDPTWLVERPTRLLRRLVDLTMPRAGKDPTAVDDVRGQARVTGAVLRDLLRRTAAAISARGGESLGYAELAARLGFGPGGELEQRVSHVTANSSLSSLMVSFYFKGGYAHLGCEFLHKSFREYLFAEEIVETLKEFGREHRGTARGRDEYWADFARDRRDFRWEFSRRLSRLLAPQWLTVDTWAHVAELLEWEIARAKEPSDAGDGVDERTGVTEPLSMERWCVVRDGLADLWDWWVEGAHQRPQPNADKAAGTFVLSTPAFVHELVEHASPLGADARREPFAPESPVAMDAHLGDALTRICARVHRLVARAQSWPGAVTVPIARALKNATEATALSRPRQTRVSTDAGHWILFAPARSPQNDDFSRAVCRINAAHGRPEGAFPQEVDLSSVDFSMAFLERAYFRDCSLRDARFVATMLPESEFQGTNLSGADLRWASLAGARLVGVDAAEARLDLANLLGTSFSESLLVRTAFDGADVSLAAFRSVDVTGASFRRVRVTPGDEPTGDAATISIILADAVAPDHVQDDGPAIAEQ